MRLYVQAIKSGWTETPQPFLLIIEEINRARKTFMINKRMRHNESCFTVCQGTEALYEK